MAIEFVRVKDDKSMEFRVFTNEDECNVQLVSMAYRQSETKRINEEHVNKGFAEAQKQDKETLKYFKHMATEKKYTDAKNRCIRNITDAKKIGGPTASINVNEGFNSIINDPEDCYTLYDDTIAKIDRPPMLPSDFLSDANSDKEPPTSNIVAIQSPTINALPPGLPLAKVKCVDKGSGEKVTPSPDDSEMEASGQPEELPEPTINISARKSRLSR